MIVPLGSGLGTFPVLSLLLLMVTLSCLVGAIVAQRLRRPPLALAPVLAACVVGAAMFGYRVVAEPNLVADENTWHQQALRVSNFLSGQTDDVGALNSGKEGYPWLVGVMYHIAAPAPILPIAMGMILLILLVPLLGLTTQVVTEDLVLPRPVQDRAVRIAMYLIALTPTIAFWGPRMLRETTSMFLITVASCCFLLFMREKRLLPAVAVVAAVLAMASVRGQIGVGLAAGLILGGVLVWTFRFPSWITRAAVLLPAFALLLVSTWLYVDSTSDLSLENTSLRNAALADADSAFDGGEAARGASSYADIVLFNLPRVVAGPFPFELSASAVMVLAAASNAFWLATIVGSWMVISRRRRLLVASDTTGSTASWKSVAVLLALALTFVAILSINAGNYGLVMRMRLMPLTALIPLAAVGFALAYRSRHHAGGFGTPSARRSQADLMLLRDPARVERRLSRRRL